MQRTHDDLDTRPIKALLWAAGSLLLAAAVATAEKVDESQEGQEEETPPALELSDEHREWLMLVEPLISDEETAYFLALDETYQRDAFIDRFWEARDPDRRTPLNELEVQWKDRAREAFLRFGDMADARAVAFLLNGPPGRVSAPDGRPLTVCYHPREQIEAWFYGGSERTERRFIVIFQLRFANRGYEIWLPGDPLQGRGRSALPTNDVSQMCRDLLPWAVGVIRQDSNYPAFIQEIMSPPRVSSEWLTTFDAYTTDLPDDAETFGLELSFEFPGRRQSRTVVQGILAIPQELLGTVADDDPETADEPTHHILLTGEVVRDERLFERFRYRFELPAANAGTDSEGRIPLVFQRYLRPGPARVIVKAEDLTTDKVARLDETIEVPTSEQILPALTESESEFLAMLREANEASGEASSIRIIPPIRGDIQVGATRFTTVVDGEVDKVTFLLDEKPVLTKRRPPYSVELNLGNVVATHLLRVEAFNEDGVVVASDELMVNQGGQRFRIRLVEPRQDRTYEQSLVAVAQVEVPDGATLERVELYLKERRLATLYQEPFELPILLDGAGLSYVRAVAYLEDGNSTEDVVFVNAPDVMDEVEVHYVELFANVFDPNGRPLLGLERSDFRVLEDGSEQQIRRFEWVESLPIHAMLLLDTSASMEDSLDQVTEAAETFAKEIIQAKDRLGLLSFASQPRVELRFSNSKAELAQALTRLQAEGGTALYDSLVFALNYFHGIKGQKALLLLSDGEDESSRFDFETTLEIARRAGVMIYVIGLEEAATNKAARKVLRELAEETGGASFFIEDLAALPSIYAQIQEELRSQYLIAYQSSSDKDPSEFRRVQVQLTDEQGEVRAMAGYYP